MDNFTFRHATKIIFGKDAELQAGVEIKAYGSKVLLHYGGGSIKKTGLYEKIVNSLKNASVEFVELPGVQPNPRLSLVREGIRFCRENGVDCILAVGGGSVIDSAKAIAAGVPYEGDVWDFFCGKGAPQKVLPVADILTLPASGSEASSSCVITNEEGWYKRGFVTEFIRPVFSILNPELTYTLPAYQTACGVADMMSHILERYFTPTKNVELTDRLCEGALKTIISNAPIALAQPDDYASRAEIMWAGTIAHNDFLSTGRRGDWASHNIEHEMSGIYDIAHGAGLSIIIPAWMKHVYRQEMNRFLQFAVRVWNVEMDFGTPERVVLEGINRLEGFFRSIGLPVRFSDAGISDERFEEMASKATNNDTKTVGNLVRLNKSQVLEIFTLAK